MSRLNTTRGAKTIITAVTIESGKLVVLNASLRMKNTKESVSIETLRKVVDSFDRI